MPLGDQRHLRVGVYTQYCIQQHGFNHRSDRPGHQLDYFWIHSVRYIFERCASSPLLPVSWEGAKSGARLIGQERKDIFENSRNLDSAVNIKFLANRWLGGNSQQIRIHFMLILDLIKFTFYCLPYLKIVREETLGKGIRHKSEINCWHQLTEIVFIGHGFKITISGT